MYTRFLPVVVLLMCAVQALAQHSYHRNKSRHYRTLYRKQISYYANACDILQEKRSAVPRQHIRHKTASVRYRPMAEFGPPGNAVVVSVTPHQQPQPEPLPAVVLPEPDEMSNEVQDKVLAENLLPVPASEKHAEIRKKVREMLSTMKEGEPIELPPLYFQFNRDELAIVNTEPFLYAVEFALHGRHILIEGHTDSQGSDQYNVQLSVKRVERIRKMMHDMGVPDDLISVVGYGEEQATASSASAAVSEDNQKFRRVDFKVF